jgi:hypothetical protein
LSARQPSAATLTTANEDSFTLAGLQTGGLPPNAGGALATSVTGNVFVTYDYAPVPLPATLALALGGIGLLGTFARRRRS